ncbi:MAG TPA: DUF4340 domain-containing protein [Candidatus Krumholzibacteria bacterium]|nr:DUF4340 domain-containing protein [Candidatus Krumholzibacteria bacterium]
MFSRTTRILLLVAALAVGTYLLVERPDWHRADVSEEAREELAPFDIARVDDVILQRPSDTLRFVRTDSTWSMVQPLEDAVEPGAIGTLLHALDKAHVERHLGPAQNPARYGLATPDVRIVLVGGGETLLDVAIGKHTVDNAWCYARTTTNDVLLIPPDVHHAATLPRDAYRDRRVANFQLRDVDGYELRTADHTTHWARRSTGWFALVHGDTLEGDTVAVEAVLRRLRGLRATSFAAGSDTLSGADGSPAATIELWKRGHAHLMTLWFTGHDSQWRIRDDRYHRICVVDDDLSDVFAHTTTGLRERHLLRFDPTDALRIVFTTASVSGELVRTGGHWAYPNPSLGHVNADHAADLVRGLRALKWTRPPAASIPAPHAAAPFVISIRGRDDTILDELRAAPAPGDSLWCVTSHSSAGPWLIEHASLAALADQFSRVRSR